MIYLAILNLYYWIYAGFWGLLADAGLARPIERRIEPKIIMEEMARKKAMEAKMGNGFSKVNGKM